MGRKSRSSSPDEFPLLKELGLKATSILGDGNCLFNALSDQVFGDQSYSKDIRAKVVQYMRDNAAEFKDFVPVELGGGHRRNPKRKNVASASLDISPITQKQIDENFDSYLKRMAANGTYGDNLEIRAFSQAYDTDVRIYNRANKFVSRVAADGVVRQTAHIALHDWEHYSSVRNINGPDHGLPNIINTDDHITSSAPSTPASSFSSSGSSSVERDLDSEDELALYGPNKKARSPRRHLQADSDVPSLCLAAAPEKKAVKIILHVKPQSQQEESAKPRRRLLTAREQKAMKKLEQKAKSKERKKEAAIITRSKTAVAAAPPTTNTISGMKTLTI